MSPAGPRVNGGRGGALQFIAEGVTALAGFEVAAISVVEQGELRTVAVAGSADAAAELVELRAPVESVLAELEPAEDWGRLRFLPEERSPERLQNFQWVPQYEPLDVPDAWHPGDLLCALLRDDDGELRGLLSVDLPRNGRRPDPTQRGILNVYAQQAEQAVVAFVQHHELTHHLAVERELSRYRRQLVDVLSHELQTPTTVIIGRAELALESQPDPELRHHLDAIARGAMRISAMTKNLLAMAKVDDPGRPLETTAVDVAAIVREVGALLHDDAHHRGIQLCVATPDHPVVTHGDSDELDTVVVNLVANAIRYNDRGGHVKLSVAGGAGSADVVVTIADDGIGIAEEDQSRLFEEFFRSAAPRARSRPGTGLGLAIVDRIVRRHHGHIDIESTLEVGTTVRVTLPAVTI
ncbi:MAG TPA: HAMP domain-containing sensor histidine kinase [Propionibacteriaceae bacterium]